MIIAVVVVTTAVDVDDADILQQSHSKFLAISSGASAPMDSCH